MAKDEFDYGDLGETKDSERSASGKKTTTLVCNCGKILQSIAVVNNSVSCPDCKTTFKA